MTKQQTALTLPLAIREYQAELAEWQSSDRNLPRPEYWKSIEAVIEAGTSGEIDEYHYAPMAELIKRYLEFLAQEEEHKLVPSDNVYRCLEFLIAARPQQVRPTETITELLGMPGMSHEQVSKMHGLPLLLIGRMAAHLAKHEYKEAEALYPKNHVTPEARDRQRRKFEDKRRYRTACEDWKSRPDFTKSHGEDAPDTWMPPPESPLELLALPGMTVEQVASMHRLPIEQVSAMRDGKTYVPSGSSDDLPAQVTDHEIVACHQGGATNEEIAEMLGLPMDRIEAAVNEYLGKSEPSGKSKRQTAKAQT